MEKKRFTFTNELLLIAVIACEIVLFGILNPRFLRPMVLLGSINDFISICIISLFVTMVIIAGGMDIQAGSIVGLTSIVIGVVFQSGVNVYVACLIAIAAGALCGLLSGFIIAYAKVPPMVVTLEPEDSPLSARTSLARLSDGSATPVMVISEPPLKSIPGLSPGLTTRIAETAMTTTAMVYQTRRLAMNGREVLPE